MDEKRPPLTQPEIIARVSSIAALADCGEDLRQTLVILTMSIILATGQSARILLLNSRESG